MNELLQQIKQMTPEDQAELAALLEKAKEETKPKPEVVQLGPPMGPGKERDSRGRPLTEEEIWDRDHPLQSQRRPYGYYETLTDFYGRTTRKNWSREEVDAYNKPIEEAWLAEKRKIFPDAVLPPNIDVIIFQKR